MRNSTPSPGIKWLAIGASLVWLLAVGWQQFGDAGKPRTLQTSYLSSRLDQCSGTVAARYSCNSRIRVAAQRQSFAFWVHKLFLVFGPPLSIAIVYNLISRRMWRQAELERRRRYAERKLKRAAASESAAVRSARSS